MIRNKKLELTSSTIGIFTTALFLISIFLPYFSIGDLDVSLYSIISTSGSNDWVGVLLLVISGSLLVSNSDKNIAAILTVIGGFFPLYRFYKINTVEVDLGIFEPSFGIGGYLILIVAVFQLYACIAVVIDKNILVVACIVFLISLDQWSKWVVKTSFNLYQSKPVIQDYFHFTFVTNDGMAFGLSFPGGKHILLVMTILLTGFIIGFLWKERAGHPLVKYGLALILSGAIGNLIDRLLYGKVVDFLDVMIGDFHWYIFNVADSAVTIGMVLFIIHSLIYERSDLKDEFKV